MSFSLTFSPPQISLILRPGGSYVRAYEVTNNGDTDLNLTTEISQWLPADSDGNVAYLPSADSNFAFKLNNADLRLGQAFILPAHGHRQLVLKITSTPKPPFLTPISPFLSPKTPTPPQPKPLSAKSAVTSLSLLPPPAIFSPKYLLLTFPPPPASLIPFFLPLLSMA